MTEIFVVGHGFVNRSMSARNVASGVTPTCRAAIFPSLKDQESRNRGNAVVAGEFLVRVNVHLADFELLRQRFDHRVYGSAGRAP